LVGERLPARSPAAGLVEGGGGPYGPGLPGLGAALATGGLRRVGRGAGKPGGGGGLLGGGGQRRGRRQLGWWAPAVGPGPGRGRGAEGGRGCDLG